MTKYSQRFANVNKDKTEFSFTHPSDQFAVDDRNSLDISPLDHIIEDTLSAMDSLLEDTPFQEPVHDLKAPLFEAPPTLKTSAAEDAIPASSRHAHAVEIESFITDYLANGQSEVTEAEPLDFDALTFAHANAAHQPSLKKPKHTAKGLETPASSTPNWSLLSKKIQHSTVLIYSALTFIVMLLAINAMLYMKLSELTTESIKMTPWLETFRAALEATAKQSQEAP